MKLIYPFMWAVLLICNAAGVNALQPGTPLLDSNHGGDGSAWGLASCDACHLLNFIHEGRNVREIVQDKGYATCTGCHGGNGTNSHRPCTVCHNERDLPSAPLQSGAENHNFIVGAVSNLRDDQCLTCHVSSNMDGHFEGNTDLTIFPDKSGSRTPYNNLAEFCLRCHNRDHQQPGFAIQGKNFRDPLVAMEVNYEFIDVHGLIRGTGQRTYAGLVDNYRYGTLVDCSDCHAMHGTHNNKLIIDNASKGAFKLAAGGNTNVTVNGGDYAQFCVLCHQMDIIVEDGDINTGNGLSGVHQVGTDCRLCHTHGQAVQTGL